MTGASSIAELPKLSLREQVSEALKSAIISGEMEPAAVYSAPSLAARFGVSATPVREAMLDLVKAGLVTIVPNKGFRVTEVDDRQLDEVTAIRQLLEPPTVRDVTMIIPADDLPDLRDLAQQIVDWARAGDLVRYTASDTAFHLKLLAYANNQRLVDLVADLRSHTRLLGLADLVDTGELVVSAEEHLAIVDLIAARDQAAVEKLMHTHIAHVRGKWARPEAAEPTAGTTLAKKRRKRAQQIRAL